MITIKGSFFSRPMTITIGEGETTSRDELVCKAFLQDYKNNAWLSGFAYEIDGTGCSIKDCVKCFNEVSKLTEKKS